jgi:hypothetical protein
VVLGDHLVFQQMVSAKIDQDWGPEMFFNGDVLG